MNANNILFECEVKNRSPIEDEPEAYRVLKSPKTRSGIMVVGKFGLKWQFNPNPRALIAKLLELLNDRKKESAAVNVLKEVNEFLQANPYNGIVKGNFMHKKIKEALKDV